MIRDGGTSLHPKNDHRRQRPHGPWGARTCKVRFTMKEVAAAIIKGRDWAPNPSPLCEWCPFFYNGCSLTVQDGNDDLGKWLDGAAD